MEWSEEMLLKLIDLYRERSLLWDPQHRYHFKKSGKANAWREIAYGLNSSAMGDEVNLTAEQCKKKIISLLSSYRREKCKIRSSQVNGKGKEDIYASRWFAYDSLKFLDNRDIPKRSFKKVLLTNSKKKPDPVEKSEDRQLQSPSHSDDLDEAASCSKHTTNELTETYSSAVKRSIPEDNHISTSSKIPKTSCETSHNISNGNTLDEKEDLFDHFGNYVAALLRNMETQTAFRLQEQITSAVIDEICSPPTSDEQSTQTQCETESDDSYDSDDNSIIYTPSTS